MTTSTISTVGHSNKSFDEFAALLASGDITTLLDVRSYPRSRWPQFQADALRYNLSAVDVRYEPRGQNLGGKGVNRDYDSTIAAVAQRVRDGEQIAVMCSEGDYRECHRFTMLTPSFLAAGLTVRHLRYGGLAPVLQSPSDAAIPEHPKVQQAPMF